MKTMYKYKVIVSAHQKRNGETAVTLEFDVIADSQERARIMVYDRFDFSGIQINSFNVFSQGVFTGDVYQTGGTLMAMHKE